MRRHSQEALANLGLKHALEDLLSALEDRASIPKPRVEQITKRLIDYLNDARNGEQIAKRRAFLLKHDEKRVLRDFDRLRGVLGEEDFEESVKRVSQTLKHFSLDKPLDAPEKEFTFELLKKFVRTVALIATPAFPNVPRKISSPR